jgi:hypothetical protein
MCMSASVARESEKPNAAIGFPFNAPLLAGVNSLFSGPFSINPRPNPSVKGTSTSGLRPLAAAPYLER